MNILVIPTTDWVRHPVPNRLNFIFDRLAGDHEVYVLHFRLGKFRENAPRATNCTLIPAGFENIDDPSFYYVLSAPKHFHAIRKIVHEKHIDVILSANILPSYFANFTGVPVVFDYLDHLEESASVYYPGSLIGGLVKKGVSTLTRFNLTHAASVITVTNELKEYLNSLGIFGVSVIPNGVSTDILVPVAKNDAKKALGLEGRTVIGYVGSLEYWVDLETVIQGLPELPDVTLMVVGPGLFTDYGSHIRKMAEDLGVGERVIFTGGVDYQKINTYISAMDIGLNPLKMMKKNEYAAGGKVFNYLSCGRPVLSSRMVSLERLLGDDLYYYDDVRTFVAQVKKILSQPQHDEHYRSIAIHFDWKTLAETYESVLKDAI